MLFRWGIVGQDVADDVAWALFVIWDWEAVAAVSLMAKLAEVERAYQIVVYVGFGDLSWGLGWDCGLL